MVFINHNSFPKRFKRAMNKIKTIIFSENFSLYIIAFSFIVLISSIFMFVCFSDWDFSWIVDEEKVAQFGDFTGGFIGTILAFAASLLYFIALKEQQKDVKTNQASLEKQIEEFSNQVDELQKTRLISQQQYNAMALQQFESQFYSNFNIYLKVKESIDGDKLDSFLVELSDKIKKENLVNLTAIESYKLAVSFYNSLFVSRRSDFAHYFRSLYRLVKMVSTSAITNIDDVRRMEYIKIIRSQLSEKELLLLYYNLHSSYAGKSKNLFYEYNMLKHLSPIRKYEIANKYDYQADIKSSVECFFDYISSTIISFINSVCRDSEPINRQLETPEGNIIVKFDYDTDVKIELKIRSADDTSKAIVKMFPDILYHQLFLSNYKSGEDNLICCVCYSDVATRAQIYDYTIPEDNILPIITDKTYE